MMSKRFKEESKILFILKSKGYLSRKGIAKFNRMKKKFLKERSKK